MFAMFRVVQDKSLWGDDNASIAEEMLMPQLLEASTSYDWKTGLQVVCQQLNVKVVVFLLDSVNLITEAVPFNQITDSKKKEEEKQEFYLLKTGNLFFPLLPKKNGSALPHVITNEVKYAVGICSLWNVSVLRGTLLDEHGDLACLFSCLSFLDHFHAKSPGTYGPRRWPHNGISSAKFARVAFPINRKTLELLVRGPLRITGVNTEMSRLKRISDGCTVIEQNASMILRICFEINSFFASNPWGPESTHGVFGGGRRSGFLLYLTTRCGMTIVSFEISPVAHAEANRIVSSYIDKTKNNPRIHCVLQDTTLPTAEQIKGLLSASRFVGSTKTFQLGILDKLIFESESMRIYWNCHVGQVEFEKLINEYGMSRSLTKGWTVVSLGQLCQERMGMTVKLWLRLPEKHLQIERSSCGAKRLSCGLFRVT